MVHLLSRCQLSLLLAFLTERVRFDIAVTDSFPGPAVAFVRCRVTLILVVAFVDNLLVLGAVLPAFSKPTAAGISTGTFWFIWHQFTSFGA
ncbi:MAG: hypothetical protein A9181_03270 [Dehalococcoides mccartyi]|nr:MAG: hypothetical protein A9181_03270 [Dehalococcoides mccartyi]